MCVIKTKRNILILTVFSILAWMILMMTDSNILLREMRFITRFGNGDADIPSRKWECKKVGMQRQTFWIGELCLEFRQSRGILDF